MSSRPLNRDAQPFAPLNARNNHRKSLDELYGLFEGILADRVLVDAEIHFLADWIATCSLDLREWPLCEIALKVAAVLADGEIAPDEAEELQELLLKAVGNLPEDGRGASQLACEDQPAPIDFAGRSFCFTGKFRFGERKHCQAKTIALGGIIRSDVNMDLDYLIIGGLASRDWAHTNHGRKIEAAVRNQQNGARTRIIGETHWCACLEL